MLGDQGVAFGGFQVFGGHFFDQRAEVGPGRPAQFLACLAGIAQQGFHFGRAEVTGIDGDDGFAMLVIGLLFDASSLPFEVDVEDTPQPW